MEGRVDTADRPGHDCLTHCRPSVDLYSVPSSTASPVHPPPNIKSMRSMTSQGAGRLPRVLARAMTMAPPGEGLATDAAVGGHGRGRGREKSSRRVPRSGDRQTLRKIGAGAARELPEFFRLFIVRVWGMVMPPSPGGGPDEDRRIVQEKPPRSPVTPHAPGRPRGRSAGAALLGGRWLTCSTMGKPETVASRPTLPHTTSNALGGNAPELANIIRPGTSLEGRGHAEQAQDP